MITNRILLTTLVVLTCSSASFAIAPPMPPATSGSGDAGMKHAGVSLSGTTLAINLTEPPASPVTMMSGHGTDFTPAKFDVLENVYFNAQHGWLPDGFFSLPAERSLWIERIGATQPASANFHVYEGGNGMEGMAAWTMNEIYIADGDKWQWDGIMQHDYFTADLPGNYSMSFQVYVGDQSGTQDTSFTPAEATFHFRVVPEPFSVVPLLLGTLGWIMKRR